LHAQTSTAVYVRFTFVFTFVFYVHLSAVDNSGGSP
jgi:hypothetical protein